MARSKKNALDLNKSFQDGEDMSPREADILKDIVGSTGFITDKVIWRSRYWSADQIGAVHYKGTYKGKPSVLKIQGVKPNISEIEIIPNFTKQNRSKIIRAAKHYHTIPWTEEQGYEAFIMEAAEGEKILESKKVQTPEAIAGFFDMYHEYRKNCIPTEPWIEKPEKPNFIDMVNTAVEASAKAFPKDPRRSPGDSTFALEGAEVLQKFYEDVPLEFMHGHFSVEDLIRQGEDVILFSHLFWKWKYPYYDAVFGYHWFMYELSAVTPDLSKDQVEEQRQIWMDALYALPEVAASPRQSKLMTAALLERAVAGLIIDNLLANPKQKISQYLTQASREQVRVLIEKLLEK